MNHDRITAMIEVTRSGYLLLDGTYYTPENINSLISLYPPEDFEFKVVPWCPLVNLSLVQNAKKLLEKHQYQIVTGG